MAKRSKLKTALAILAAALVVAAAALAPRYVLAAQEAALLRDTHSYQGGTGQLEYSLPAENIPLAQALYTAEEIGYDSEINYQVRQSREAVGELLPRVVDYCYALAEAGALPYEVLDYLHSEIFTLPSLNFTHYYESRGVEVIHCNLGMGVSPPFYISFNIDLSTGLVVSALFQLPPKAPHLPAQTDALLEAWLAYLGLDAVKDWQPIGAHEDVALLEEGWYSSITRQTSEELRMDAIAVWMLDTTQDGINALSFSVNSYHSLSEEDWKQYLAALGASG